MTDTNKPRAITPEKVQELLDGSGYTSLQFNIAQVDSMCYPPDKNHGSIRLNSTTAYIYSKEFMTGNSARKVTLFLDKTYDIAREYLKMHEENTILKQKLFDERGCDMDGCHAHIEAFSEDNKRLRDENQRLKNFITTECQKGTTVRANKTYDDFQWEFAQLAADKNDEIKALRDVLLEFSNLEVRGHSLINRLQFSEYGRDLSSRIEEALALTATDKDKPE